MQPTSSTLHARTSCMLDLSLFPIQLQAKLTITAKILLQVFQAYPCSSTAAIRLFTQPTWLHSNYRLGGTLLDCCAKTG